MGWRMIELLGDDPPSSVQLRLSLPHAVPASSICYVCGSSVRLHGLETGWRFRQLHSHLAGRLPLCPYWSVGGRFPGCGLGWPLLAVRAFCLQASLSPPLTLSSGSPIPNAHNPSPHNSPEMIGGGAKTPGMGSDPGCPGLSRVWIYHKPAHLQPSSLTRPLFENCLSPFFLTSRATMLSG